jgi:aspartate carbamoyltransferase catalytic subunit
MVEVSERELKKVPTLRGKTIVNMFFEASTRTRTSFEIAGKRLSADVINLSANTSSVSKGETLYDTARTIEAMRTDVLVVRHSSSGAAHFLAQQLERVSVINAGDGMHEHPTQALLDCLTLRQHFKDNPSLSGLTIAIVGDALHSRVARSNLWAHLRLGNKVRVVGPRTLVPEEFTSLLGCHSSELHPPTPNLTVPNVTVPNVTVPNVTVHHDLASGLEGVDVVMCLRVQTERLAQFYIPTLEDYSRRFCVTSRLLDQLCPRAVLLHPGPANRGVELTSELIDSARSLVRRQVTNGVAVRMAALFFLGSGGSGFEVHH